MRVLRSQGAAGERGSTLGAEVEQALNVQLNLEMLSAHVYLAMSAHFEAQGLPGFAHWMRVQSREEFKHAMKLYEYIVDRRGRVTIEEIPRPPSDFGTPAAVVGSALDQERQVQEKIHGLYEFATRDRDYGTEVFLQWFVAEQVEEEKSMSGILDALAIVGEEKVGLFMLDRELARRES